MREGNPLVCVYAAFMPLLVITDKEKNNHKKFKKMKRKSFLAALLLMVAGLQTSWGQGFRVYKSDGTVAQFSLRTDSIVFYDGIGTDEEFGPFTPVNQCIAKKWYKSKTETVTFNEDGTTDYLSGGTYKFFPYQGTVLIYNAAGLPVTNFRVLELTADKMTVSEWCNNDVAVWATSPQPVLVQEIVLSETSLTLLPDATKDLSATVLPVDADNPSVTWESSNEEVAEVSKKGKVIANAVGTCTITCRATDGSGVYAECQVTVSDIVYVSEIILDETSASIKVGATRTITATVYPDNAANKNLAWESSDKAVATVDNGVVTGVEVGTCTITCRAMDGSGKYAECQVTVLPIHEYVDLGLPSGTKWATCNVGANSPEEYGDYFAWGETEPKSKYDWASYKYSNGSEYTMTKYCTQENRGNDGFTDNLIELLPADDAATANWGSGWQMPSLDQLKELSNSANTTMEWTQLNGVNGCKITSKSNGNSIFLPAAGYYAWSSPSVEVTSSYWSRSLFPATPCNAYVLNFNSYAVNIDWNTSSVRFYRFLGLSVRPVRVP